MASGGPHPGQRPPGSQPAMAAGENAKTRQLWQELIGGAKATEQAFRPIEARRRAQAAKPATTASSRRGGLFGARRDGVLALPLLAESVEAAEWRIERMSGNVQIHDGESWVALDPGRALNAGDSIWTGRNGRILLMNDQGSVLLAPKSLVKIPAQALPNSFSVLFQTHGTVSAKVNKRRKRHFSIQTPDLVAVVKGADFDVKIEKKQTRVAVSEGLVGVVDIDTGERIDVAAGGVRVNRVIDRFSGDTVRARVIEVGLGVQPHRKPAVADRVLATTRKSAALRVPSLPRSAPQRLTQTMSIAPSAVGRVEPEKMPLFSAAVGLTMAAAVPSIAQTSTLKLTADEALARLDRLDDEVAKVWASSPLAFRNVTVVNSAEGFGDFERRDGDTFKAGETLMVYVEPVGFTYVLENGRYSFALSADLSIESDAGQIITEGEDLFLIDDSSYVQIREFHMVLSVKIPDIKAGGYRAVYRVKDVNTGKTGSFSVPFTTGG